MDNCSTKCPVVTVSLNPALDYTFTLERLMVGEVNRASRVHERPGGKGVNVAVALAGSGIPVVATGFLGRENAGLFTSFFSKFGIIDRYHRLPGATRTSIKIVDLVAGQTTDVNAPGLAPTLLDLLDLRNDLLELAASGVTWFVLSGSLPPQVDAGFYRDLIRDIKSRGAKVCLDTSGEPLRLAYNAGADILKPNVHELAELVGRELPDEASVIRAASNLGLLETEVVVSFGAEGACFVSAEGTVIARPPKITKRSTVGAGDAMVAGIIAAHLAGDGLVDRARRATAFSVAALTMSPDATITPAMIEEESVRVSVASFAHTR